MTRYRITKTHRAYGYVTTYVLCDKKDADEVMARAEKDPINTYELQVETDQDKKGE